MGKLLLAAFVGGVISALLTVFLAAGFLTGDRRAEVDRRLSDAEASVRAAEEKSDVAARRADLMQKRFDSVVRDTREFARTVAKLEEQSGTRPAAPATAPDGAPPPPTAPDGTPYVSRADLDAAIAKARTTGAIAVAPQPIEQKTVEEIAEEMGLSAGEEANVRQILRDSEEEAIKCLFGDRPLPEIRDELKAARDDPDRMQQVLSETIARGFQNAGKLMTLEARTRRKVEGVLDKERAKEFLQKPRKPVLEKEYGEILKDTFDVSGD